jgi:CBS domain-containing protein
MSKVAQILASKAAQAVYTVAPNTSVYDALKLMAEKNVGALPVMEAGKVVGLITERLYARQIALVGRSSKDTPVAAIMDKVVCYIDANTTREECMALMTEKRRRHLIVVGGDKLTGLISIGDVVKDIITEQRFIIDQLEHYIAGDRG